MKRYEAAISILTPLLSSKYLKSALIWKDPLVDLRPAILAVLAMANHSLGNDATSEGQLKEAHEIMSPDNNYPHLHSLLREAVNMIKSAEPETSRFR